MSNEVEAVVSSIGINEVGKSVVRVYVNKKLIDVATDVASFAKLAEEGVCVKNDFQKRK